MKIFNISIVIKTINGESIRLPNNAENKKMLLQDVLFPILSEQLSAQGVSAKIVSDETKFYIEVALVDGFNLLVYPDLSDNFMTGHGTYKIENAEGAQIPYTQCTGANLFSIRNTGGNGTIETVEFNVGFTLLPKFFVVSTFGRDLITIVGKDPISETKTFFMYSYAPSSSQNYWTTCNGKYANAELGPIILYPKLNSATNALLAPVNAPYAKCFTDHKMLLNTGVSYPHRKVITVGGIKYFYDDTTKIVIPV